MRKRISGLIILLLCFALGLNAAIPYDTVPGDPIKTRIYTLPNGLKVFMSVNKDRPRIQTYIAVRVGGKNDPAETTGLAHYFEHLMFKGTEQFGTSDYTAEKPLLDSIEQAFEIYRRTEDSAARAAIYHKIDSLSYQASLIAIPNEYDKLMAAIGADGTNAYTSMDVTCYVEDIPSNQIENWARIQADRFAHPVLRGFHTELETIYEEKNMSLKDDSDRVFDALFSELFPDHPYGTQTVLGTQEHLKNPSITNVKAYHSKWYVPNNMAIAMAGDFDPDESIETIARYFGPLKPNPDLQRPAPAGPRTAVAPVSRQVIGPEAEAIYLAWRMPGKNDSLSVTAIALDNVLNNSYCGIIDRNVNLPQLTLDAGAFLYQQADGGSIILYGEPAPGQTLEEVRDILLAQVDSLREGRFDESLLEAVANNRKLSNAYRFESNSGRANLYVQAFVNGQSWADALDQLTKSEDVTRADIMALAREYMRPENYVAVYKLQGQDTTLMAIEKPALTPIATNRDAHSAFLDEIPASEVTPIEPLFVDFERDLTILTAKGDTPVYYTPNESNDIFQLELVYETGWGADWNLRLASGLLEYASTPTKDAAEIQREFYELACRYSVSIGQERSYISLSGLNQNMEKALSLLMEFISQAQVDTDTFDQWVENIAQSRLNERSNENSNFSALVAYMMYGENNQYTSRPSIEQIKATGPEKILDSLKALMDYRHRVIYYGGESSSALLSILDSHTPDKLMPAPVAKVPEVLPTTESVIYVAPFDMPQADLMMLTRLDKTFDPEFDAARSVYNNYFGGGMNSIVFQEMRESRSLAYSAWSALSQRNRPERPYLFRAYIGTQIDKLPDAMAAFDEIINNMPESQAAFDISLAGLENNLRTERSIKDEIAWKYVSMQDLGMDRSLEEVLYESLPQASLEKVLEFQKENIKGRTYRYAILGPVEKMDLENLAKYGRVVVLTTDDIFSR